jgi:threonine dehydratase
VYRASLRLRDHLQPTPLVPLEGVSRTLGIDVWAKLDTLLPTRAFKVRGGLNWMSVHAPEVRTCGVITASTGNHGQSIAYAAQRFGVAATIFMPRDPNPAKVAAIESYGGHVRLCGTDMAESAAVAREEAERTGARFISSGNDLQLIAGVATSTLEALQTRSFDAVIVPAGSGSNAAGACIVAGALSEQTAIIAVQSSGAPAAHDAFISRKSVRYDDQSTLAEGMATRESYAMPQALMAERLKSFGLVRDRELLDALALLVERDRHIVELSTVAGLAWLIRERRRMENKRVLLPFTGANLEAGVMLSLRHRVIVESS